MQWLDFMKHASFAIYTVISLITSLNITTIMFLGVSSEHEVVP